MILYITPISRIREIYLVLLSTLVDISSLYLGKLIILLEMSYFIFFTHESMI